MNRSQIMQAIHSKDTKPELLVRDIKTSWKLSMPGFRVATVWECSIKSDEDSIEI